MGNCDITYTFYSQIFLSVEIYVKNTVTYAYAVNLFLKLECVTKKIDLSSNQCAV
jgi:hypothetical protein